MVRGALAAVVVTVASQTFAEAPVARQGWYPKAGDLCAEYITKMSKPDQYSALVTRTKDPAIAKFVSDFNAASGIADKGGWALGSLLVYCRAHATTRLGDVTAGAVMNERDAQKADMAKPSASAETTALDPWYRQALNTCAGDDECKKVVKRANDNSVACIRGDAKACSEKDSDLLAIGRWNARRANVAPQFAPSDASTQCLQDTVRSLSRSCRQEAEKAGKSFDAVCPGDNLIQRIRLLQQENCGFSPIQPAKPTQAPERAEMP